MSQRLRLSVAMSKRLRSGGSAYSRAKHGRRADLDNRFFRSAWEANYARYLTFLTEHHRIASWEYEPTTFWFDHIKRGVRSYTPDFRIVALDGGHYWVEVKGWMDPKSATKLKRFRRWFREERMEVVDARAYKNLASAVGGLVKHWEP